MDQFNNTMKLSMLAPEENQSLLTDTKKVPDSERYGQLHQKVLSFKHKMARCLKKSEVNNIEVKSRMISKSQSSRKRSKSWNSRCSKVLMEERAIEQNNRLAEAIAESNYAAYLFLQLI